VVHCAPVSPTVVETADGDCSDVNKDWNLKFWALKAKE